jgi:hypothetical protein
MLISILIKIYNKEYNKEYNNMNNWSQVHKITFPSDPVLNSHGCNGWNIIFLTPYIDLILCPLNTFNGIITASCNI